MFYIRLLDYFRHELDGAATLISINSSEDGRGSFVRHRTMDFVQEPNVSFYDSGNLDTMVVNDPDSEEDTGSVVVHDTGSSSDLDKQDQDQQKAFEMLDAAVHVGNAVNEGTLTHTNFGSELSDVNIENHSNSNVRYVCFFPWFDYFNYVIVLDFILEVISNLDNLS